MRNLLKMSLNGINRFKLIWKSGLTIGYHSATPFRTKSSIMLLNGVVLSTGVSFLVLCLALKIMGYAHDYYLSIVPVTAAVLICNYNNRYSAARLLYITSTLLMVCYWCYAGQGSGNEFVLIIIATTSTLIFTRRVVIYFMNFLCGGTFLLYKFYEMGHPIALPTTGHYSLMPWIVLLLCIGIVSFQISFFKDVANHYKDKLSLKNEELNTAVEFQKLIEEELMASNEELKTTNDQLNYATQQLGITVRQKSYELETYMEAINFGVYSSINDLNGNFLTVNEPLIATSGYSKEELIGKNYDTLSSGHHSEAFCLEKNETIMSGRTWRGEVKCKKKDGTYFWSDCVVIPIKDENDSVKCFLSLGLPITERILGAQMKEQTLAVLETIAFETSHKVRGPLARIMGLSNLIQMDLIGEKEFKNIASKFSICSEELNIATSGLVSFVNNHQDMFA